MDRIATAGSVMTAIRETDNTRTGKATLATFQGSEFEMIAKRAELIALGASDVQVESVGNGWYQCHAGFGGGFDGSATDFPEAPSIHELQVSVLQTSVWRSQIVKKYLTSRQIGIIRRIVSDYQAGLYPVSGSSDTAEVSAESDLQTKIAATGSWASGRNETKAKADALSLFKAVAYDGQEDFIEYLNVYRRTLNAATPDQVRATYDGAGKIWTTAEVQTWEGIDPTGFFQLDAGKQWLKARPEIVSTFGQKTQVVYSYTECQVASGMTYEAYGTATLIYAPAT